MVERLAIARASDPIYLLPQMANRHGLVAGATCALLGGLAIGFLVRDPTRFLRHLPSLLAAAIALFVVTVVFFS